MSVLDINNRSGLLVVGLVVVIASALVKCKPQARLSGRVTLEYSGTSEGKFRFRLANGSAKPVRFPGWSFVFGDTLPQYILTCEVGNTVTAEVGPPFHVPPPRIAESINVSPGEALQLAVPNFDFARPEVNGSRCYLELTLEGGTSLKSNGFVR